MFVSELSLRRNGWAHIFNFVLTGLLVLVLAADWAPDSVLARHHERTRTRTGSRSQSHCVRTLHHRPLVDVRPIECARNRAGRFRRPGLYLGALLLLRLLRARNDAGWRPLAEWTLAIGVVLTAGIPLLKISQQPESGLFEWKGLVQRVLLVTFMAWIFAVASRLRRR